jgi:hypothetical protein
MPSKIFGSSFRQDKLSKFTEWVITIWILRISAHLGGKLGFRDWLGLAWTDKLDRRLRHLSSPWRFSQKHPPTTFDQTHQYV